MFGSRYLSKSLIQLLKDSYLTYFGILIFLTSPFLKYGVNEVVSPIEKLFQLMTLIWNTSPLMLGLISPLFY